MIQHARNEQGLSIASRDAKNAISTASASSQWGYIPKANLALLLSAPDCVGLRVYNAFNRTSADQRIIVVAIIADGFEIEVLSNGLPGYTLSSMHNENTANQTFSNLKIEQINRDMAKTIAETSSSDIQFLFASYFSFDVITSLMNNSECTGLSFSKIPNTLSAFPSTHLATPVKFNANNGKFKLTGGANDFMACKEPCPPRCTEGAAATAAGSASIARDSAILASTTDAALATAMRYLVTWPPNV
jgi:hypothetical protein